MFCEIYKSNEAKDIERHAQQIQNHCLREYLLDLHHDIDAIQNKSNKGQLGQLVEEFLFGYKPNSRKEADFNDAGVELKVTPLKQLRNGNLTIKERLVLSIINFNTIINENWENNTLFPKLHYLLLMFYLHENKSPLDLIFKLVSLWKPSPADLLIIEQDWNYIVNKIKAGKAHELSEADTNYLGACPKGKNSLDVVSQPNSDIKAMRRAFSFKTSYIRSIYDEINKTTNLVKISETGNFETRIKEVFAPYIGKSLDFLISQNNLDILRTTKHFNKVVIDSFLKQKFGAETDKLEEFKKANISLKTIVLKKNGCPKESMSFKQIQYKDIVNENWEDFEINKIHQDGRFLWVIFKINKSYSKQSDISLNDIILEKVMFWSMPYSDLQIEYKKLWEDTKAKIQKGDYTHFLGSKDNRVGHIRPKGRNSKDLMETPQGTFEKKKCFWINASYIAEQIKQTA